MKSTFLMSQKIEHLGCFDLLKFHVAVGLLLEFLDVFQSKHNVFFWDIWGAGQSTHHMNSAKKCKWLPMSPILCLAQRRWQHDWTEIDRWSISQGLQMR